MSRLHLLPAVRIVDTVCIFYVQGNKVLSLSADDATDCREILRYATLCVMRYVGLLQLLPHVFCLILVTTMKGLDGQFLASQFSCKSQRYVSVWSNIRSNEAYYKKLS